MIIDVLVLFNSSLRKSTYYYIIIIIQRKSFIPKITAIAYIFEILTEPENKTKSDKFIILVYLGTLFIMATSVFMLFSFFSGKL